jgi:hypothetical protein
MFLTLYKTIGVRDLNGLRVKNRGLLKQGIYQGERATCRERVLILPGIVTLSNFLTKYIF